MYRKEIIEHCTPIVIEEIRNMLECTNPMYRYQLICDWVEDNLTRKTWSHKGKSGWRLSYGLKHRCEDDLGFYVANNWIKLAMLENGLDVLDANCIDYYTGKLSFQYTITEKEVLDNTISFIYRKV